MTQWKNWSGNVQAHPQAHVHVADETALAEAIRQSPAPIRVCGAGHSFSPLLETQGGTHLHLDGLTQVQAEPGDTLAARVGCGVRLRDLTPQLHALGQALSNMGDIDAQRVGGALATGTHGTGCSFGTYSAMARELVVFDGQGQRLVATPEREADVFHAMAVSLGTGGIVSEAVLATEAPYCLHKRRFLVPLEALLDDLCGLLHSKRCVEFFYITHSGMALGLESHCTDDACTVRPADQDQEGLAQLRLLGQCLGWAPGLRRWVLNKALRGHVQETFIQDWHKAYASDRDRIRFNETEYHLPEANATQALREVIALVERDFPHVYFPMEIRCVAADDLWLSPFYQRASVSIAVHHEAGKPFEALLQAVEPIFLRHAGRPHWGKQHSLTAAELRPRYPRFDDAVAVRRELDPQGRFNSPYMQRLLDLPAPH
ncbi:MAG: D-arabinono-1,4-lactone oxidase [Brachymonas sp.]|nr:D-arabinono-1,4-lactone oxidase [Brachymonas sp.]